MKQKSHLEIILLGIVSIISLVSILGVHEIPNAYATTVVLNHQTSVGIRFNTIVNAEEFTGLPVGAKISSLGLKFQNNGSGTVDTENQYNTNDAVGGANTIVSAEQFTGLPAHVTINSVMLGVGTAAGNVRVKVYDDSSGVPNNLLGESGSVAVTGTGYQNFSMSATVPSNGIVWAAFETDSSALNVRIKNFGVGNNIRDYVTHTYSSGPNPFGSGTFTNTAIDMGLKYHVDGQLRVKIYKDDGGSGLPGTLLGESNSINISGINVQNFSVNATVPASGNVWGAFETNSTLLDAYDETSLPLGTRETVSHTYGSGPNPFGSATGDTTAFWMSLTYNTDVTSTDTRLESSGEQRVSYFNGTINYEFYYNGTSANIFYRYSADGGNSWSPPASTASGALASNSYFGVYGESNKVVLTWANTTKLLSMAGKINGGLINWNSTIPVLKTLGSTKPGQYYYPSFEKFNSTNLFLGFNVVVNSTNQSKVYYTKNLGTSWTLTKTIYSSQSNAAPIGLARYDTAKLVAIFPLYSQSEFNYSTFTGSTNTWTGNKATTGAGLSPNALKTKAFSITSNGTCAWIGYVKNNTGGNPKSITFCGSFTSPTSINTGTALYPTISSIGNDMHLFYVNATNNIINRIINVGGTWSTLDFPFGTLFTSPAYPHAEKYGYGGHHIPAVWREGTSPPFTVKFNVTKIEWESSSGYLVSYPNTGNQNEDTVTVYPLNQQILFDSFFNATGNDFFCHVFNSTNGGTIWSSQYTVPVTTDGADQGSDPVITASKNGTLYTSCLSFHVFSNKTSSPNDIVIAKYSTNSHRWSLLPTPVQTSKLFAQDKEWIAADRSSNSTTQNNLYLTWANFTNQAVNINEIKFKRIQPPDSSSQVLVNGTLDQLRGPTIAIGPQGQVYVAYDNYTSGEIDLKRSYNAGAAGTWVKPIVKIGNFTSYPTYTALGGREGLKGWQANFPFRAAHFQSMDVDSNGVIRVTYETYNGSYGGDILYSQSTNCKTGNSQTDPCGFSTPIKINLDNTLTDQFQPQLVISAKTSPTVHVVAYDRRDDSSNRLWIPYDYHCSITTDCTKIANWANTMIVNVQSSNFDGGSIVGDYHGLTSSTIDEAYPTWTADIDPLNPTNYDIYGDRSRP